MKHFIYLMLFFLNISGTSSAKNTIFTFNPVDASNTIDSIKIVNITTRQVTWVKGTNQILYRTTSTNTDKILNNIRVYPNPSSGKTVLQFYNTHLDNVTIQLVNSLGQTVESVKQNLEPGLQKFEITTAHKGIYFVQVSTNSRKFSRKLIAIKGIKGSSKIRCIGLNSKLKQEKSSKVEEPELLHFYVYSGEHITKIADTPMESKTYDVAFFICKDKDERNYPIVEIGEQWWMAENLGYLPAVNLPSMQSYTEPYYYVFGYLGDNIVEAKASGKYKTFGALYNWEAALEVCPAGWHLPGNDEWEQLAQFISSVKGPYAIVDKTDWEEVGKHLKSTGTQQDGDGLWYKYHDWDKGTDDFGFSGLPGGYRNLNGAFSPTAPPNGHWWSSTELNLQNSWYFSLIYRNTRFAKGHSHKPWACSVRCLKNK